MTKQAIPEFTQKELDLCARFRQTVGAPSDKPITHIGLGRFGSFLREKNMSEQDLFDLGRRVQFKEEPVLKVVFDAIEAGNKPKFTELVDTLVTDRGMTRDEAREGVQLALFGANPVATLTLDGGDPTAIITLKPGQPSRVDMRW